MVFDVFKKLNPFFIPIWMLAFFCAPPKVFNQNLVIDSLKTELTKANEDTTRILLTNELARQLYTTNKDSAQHLLQTAISQANKINFASGLFDLWFTKAYIHLQFNQLDSAFTEFSLAKKFASEIGNKKNTIRALNALSYCVQNKRLGLPYLHEALGIARVIKDKEQQAAVMTSIGIVYSRLSEQDSAEFYYKQSLSVQEERGDKKSQADILRNLGNNAGRGNQPEKALEYYEQGIRIMRELGKKSEEAAIYNMVGYTYSNVGNYPKALESFLTALKLMEADGYKKGIAECYRLISDINVSMQDYSQAVIYIEKSLALSEEMGMEIQRPDLGTEIQRPDLLFKKGYVYRLKGDCDTAMLFLKQSLAMKKATGQTINDNHYSNIGHCFSEQNRLDSALFYFQKALDVAREANNIPGILLNLVGVGKLHFQQGDTEVAIRELKEASVLGGQSGRKEREMEAAELLYKIYKSQNNPRQALLFFEIYHNLQDSLFNEKNVREIGRMEADYEFEKEKQQLAFEQQKERERQSNIRRFMVIAMALALLFIAVIYSYYRSKQRANTKLSKLNKEILQQKEKLEELDVAKTRFFTNISHEFRTPLTIISGMADQIREKPDQWLDKGTKMIKHNTAGLLNLVNQILELRKLESNEIKVEMVHGDVVQYLRYIAESYQSLADRKGIQLHFLSSQPEIKMDYDADKLLRIVSNLLSNAIKFTPEGGNTYFQVDKKMSRDTYCLHLRVEDTGIGIPVEELHRVFDRFYQVDDSTTRQTEGTGIGLALTKELVKLLGGEIEVSSNVGKGTAFSVDLPITISPTAMAPVVDEFLTTKNVSIPNIEYSLVASQINTVENIEGKPTLLIVEDNTDVQQFLAACLGDHYILEVANNGQEGIDRAIEQVPDLIVSDVMMPKKDGYALTHYLKNDERTDHIPIVLLTAKADMDSKITGLEKGADAYLAKPFDKRELLVRLEKLLELRKKLQTHYAQFSFSENDQEKIEDPFLQKFYALVEKELSNPDLDMNQLCRSLSMSRSQVFRKLKALTGKSATLFIRSIRLQQAKKLLTTSNLTVSEVAYEVGFSSPSYFSTAFLEEFGISPGATRK